MQVIWIVGLTFLGASAALYFWAESLKKSREASVGNGTVSTQVAAPGQPQRPQQSQQPGYTPDSTPAFLAPLPDDAEDAPLNPLVPGSSLPAIAPPNVLPEPQKTIKSLRGEISEVFPNVEIDLEHETKYQVKREVRITYSRMSYTGRACHINIKVGKERGALPPMTAEEQHVFKKAPDQWMQFEAYEPDPLVHVELKYAEGEFSAARTKQQQRLKRNEETLFQFVMKPLKNEDCILSVVISYVLPESRVLQVSQTSHVSQTSQTSQTTASIIAEQDDTAEDARMQEILATDLVITVNSMFGLGASQANLAKNAIGILGAAVLLFIAIQSGQLVSSSGQVDGLKVTGYVIITVANAAGIPIVDAVKNLYPSSSKAG